MQRTHVEFRELTIGIRFGLSKAAREPEIIGQAIVSRAFWRVQKHNAYT